LQAAENVLLTALDAATGVSDDRPAVAEDETAVAELTGTFSPWCHDVLSRPLASGREALRR
jgi:hypothetical protein